MADRPVNVSDEVELIEYLKVIWKRKYLILVGTVICAMAAGVVSILVPKTYRIETVIQPGVVKIDEGGNKIYIDSPKNIKSMIDSGKFTNDILNSLEENDENREIFLHGLDVTTSSDSNYIKISYDTADINSGINILNLLINSLKTHYNQQISIYSYNYKKKISGGKSQISMFKNKIYIIKDEIKNLSNRIIDLQSEIKFITNNTNSLIQERNEILNVTNEKDILSTFLYSNTIQQNIALKNSYKNEIYNYTSQIGEKKFQLKQWQREVEIQAQELEELEKENENIQNLQVVQSHTGKPQQIRPKMKFNIVFAAAAGFLFSMFLAFFLEYFSKHRRNLD